MIHVTAHFALGGAIGTLCTVGPVLRAVLAKQALSRPLGRCILVAYAFGLFAVVPNIMLNLGLPEGIYAGAWANLFFGHPALDALHHGARVPGQAALVVLFGLQYVALCLACLKARGAS